MLSADPDLLASFKVDGKAPRSVIVMTVDEDLLPVRPRRSCAPICGIPTSGSTPRRLPTPGQILAEMSENRVGGEDYDRQWPERARQTMW